MKDKQDEEIRQPDSFEYEEVKPEDEIDASLNLKDLIDHINVAEKLEEEQLKRISLTVMEGYNVDKTSRSHREASMKDAMNMALHVTQEKNFPWPKASNVIYPLISNASISFAARAYPAIVKDGEVVDIKVIGSDEGTPLVDPNTGQEIINPDTVQPMQDPQTGETVPDMSNAEPVWQIPPGAKEERGKRVKVYMNYQFSEVMEEWEEDTDKLLNALPVVGNMFRKIYWDVEEERVKSHLVYPANLIINYNARSVERAPRLTEELEYYPYEVEEMIRSGQWLDGDYMAQTDQVMEEQSDREEEVSNTYSDDSAPHVFIEQLCRIDLDGDGYAEPYIVTVHKGSDQVVRIVANFQEDGIVKGKKKGKRKIKRINPETYFIKYGFIPAPDGSIYDMGFGELLLHQNKTINTTINQMLDAGTLSNTSTGLIGRGLRMKGGNVRLKMGEFATVDSRGGAIRDNFVQIQHPEPSVVLFQLLGLLIDNSEKMASLMDVLQGEQMANQSGIATLALVEQGLTAYKAIYKRVSRSIRKEIRVVHRLNQLYLNDDKYSNVLDKPMEISRQDFDSKDFDIVPVSSPHMVSDMQRLARAQYLDSLRGDPYTDQMELRKRIYKMASIDDYDKLITEPPAPQTDPMIELQQMMTQVEGLKADIKERERQDKANKDKAEFALETEKAGHKAQIEELQASGKARETEFKIADAARQLDIKMIESGAKNAKTDAEVQKIGVQVLDILAGIRRDDQKLAMEMQGHTNGEAYKVEENGKRDNEMAEIKQLLTAMSSQEPIDIAAVIAPLADAIKGIEDGGNNFAVEIQGIKETIGGLSGGSMKDMIEPLAEAIKSLKTEDKVKKITMERNEQGNLTGEITTGE